MKILLLDNLRIRLLRPLTIISLVCLAVQLLKLFISKDKNILTEPTQFFVELLAHLSLILIFFAITTILDWIFTGAKVKGRLSFYIYFYLIVTSIIQITMAASSHAKVVQDKKFDSSKPEHLDNSSFNLRQKAVIRQPVLVESSSDPMSFHLEGSGGNCYGCTVIQASGTIVSTTDKDFKEFYDKNSVDFVNFDSSGGNIAAAIRLGEIIRSHGIHTSVFNGKPSDVVHSEKNSAPICASACVLAFIGGVVRYVPDDAKIGVHQFSFDKKSGMPDTANAISDVQEISGVITAYIREMGVSPELAELGSLVPNAQVYWLSKADLIRMNVITKKPLESNWIFSINETIKKPQLSIDQDQPDAAYSAMATIECLDPERVDVIVRLPYRLSPSVTRTISGVHLDRAGIENVQNLLDGKPITARDRVNPELMKFKLDQKFTFVSMTFDQSDFWEALKYHKKLELNFDLPRAFWSDFSRNGVATLTFPINNLFNLYKPFAAGCTE